ncbi:MAG: hypothetical protein SGILL_001740 [Bacillariaceae sp.]
MTEETGKPESDTTESPYFDASSLWSLPTVSCAILPTPEKRYKRRSLANEMSGVTTEKPSWDRLEEIEETRRKILRRVEVGFPRILFYWEGTCIRALMMDWLVWLTMVIFIGIRICAHSGLPEPPLIGELGDTNIDILGGFISFLLVIFVNQTNDRFVAMYQLSKRCAGLIQDVAGLVSSLLPEEDGKRIVRYMNSAHIAGYVGLGGPYSQKYFFKHFDEEHGLLTPREMARVQIFNMDNGSAAFKDLVTWSQREVAKAKNAGYIDSIEATNLHEKVIGLRAAMDGLYDYTDQPTHFFYIHFLVFISAVYLPLFAVDNAYSCGWGDETDWRIEALNGSIVLLQAIFVVGLRLLGQRMLDPYGDDLEDLSVITYVVTTINNSNIIFSARVPGDPPHIVDPK